jgi:hypothetical protein
MPQVDVFIYGKIPAVLEIDNEGYPLDLSVETRHGIKWADMTQEELEKFAEPFEQKIQEAMEEFKRNWDAWKYDRCNND